MLAQKIINWYLENGRKLPWRETNDPYRIWLSEIILQQTRIDQGLKYYLRFVEEYPTVSDLAKAPTEQVLKSWQGLGYYSRARNLHTTAQHIANNLGGEFPKTYNGLLALKGIGRYTAAAIASFAYRLPHPVIDGNVYRFISRLYGINTPIGTTAAYRQFEDLLSQAIDTARPDLFNQAIMDFGSIYCKPSGSLCDACIFRQECVARSQGTVAALPVKATHTKVTERYFYYLDTRWSIPSETLLTHERGQGDIWQGLFELPLLETDHPIPADQLLSTISQTAIRWFGEKPISIAAGPAYKHQLTHRTIFAQFIHIKYLCQPPKTPQYLVPTSLSNLKSLPISRLIDRYLTEM